MEASLVPLDVFNDAERLARSMQASHLIPRITEQATECMDELLTLLASKVRVTVCNITTQDQPRSSRSVALYQC